jgi:HSP20 family protein
VSPRRGDAGAVAAPAALPRPANVNADHEEDRAMKIDDIRQGFGSLWDSVAEGWDRLRQGAAGALTRLQPSDRSNLPARTEVDDGPFLPGPSWAMLGGDVFEDDRRVVVRLEAPGMEREDFNVQLIGDALVVRGEKKFERESSQGRWRVLQCAYGAFHRSVPLPAAVRADAAKASYRNGVLRVELPKRDAGTPQARRIPIG